MSVGQGVLEYRRLRAPRDDGATLLQPDWEQIPSLIRENRSGRSCWNVEISGESLSELSHQARGLLIGLARDYSGKYLPQLPSLPSGDFPLVLSGHQPVLFHPGVWFKNFLIGRIAPPDAGLAVNLIIDNDHTERAAISVPAGTPAQPGKEYVAFDTTSPFPFEDREIGDRSLLESFPNRVAEYLAPFVTNSILPEFWTQVLVASKARNNLGACLAQARHIQEYHWGSRTLEVPLSALCDTRPFQIFALHILSHLPRFHQIYNSGILRYRQVNRIRSQTHPVPELKVQGDWLESPFWLWSREAPRRRPLFVRHTGDNLELSNRAGVTFTIPAEGHALGEIQIAAERGLRLRPRALLTTMFARLLLSDLFIHGIGGAKYDQLTDVLIREFFGVLPPEFVIATATGKLPIDRVGYSSEDLTAIERQLRDIRFHGEKSAASHPAAPPLIAEKRHLIRAANDQEESSLSGRERHLAFERTNAALESLLHEERGVLEAQRENLLRQARVEKVLGSREFAFCLFPEATLKDLLLDI